MQIAMTGEMNYLRAERLIPIRIGEREREADREYMSAAVKGHAAAQFKYGYMLSRGIGGKVDVKKGMRFIKRSARQGYPPAVTETARGYYYGFGFQRNLKKAFKAWEFGSKLGISEASYYLALAYLKGEGVKKDGEKAEKLFETARKGGFSPKV